MYMRRGIAHRLAERLGQGVFGHRQLVHGGDNQLLGPVARDIADVGVIIEDERERCLHSHETMAELAGRDGHGLESR